MVLKLIYPRWGSSHLEWPIFLQKAQDNGYQGVEIDLPLQKDEKTKILNLLKEFNLDFVAQHWETKSSNFKEHKESLKRHLYNLAEAGPLLINSHTGMDFFSFKQNLELLILAQEIEKETNITITHETHRSRFSFAAHVCLDYLRELPDLKLTSDFSHWCCVAESMLENQEEAVSKAIEHTFHVHARVGSAQSPQVIDPRDPRYKVELLQFKTWWVKIMQNSLKSKRSFLTVTPEYGPFPYSQFKPYTQEPIASQWEINQFIKDEILVDWENS